MVAILTILGAYVLWVIVVFVVVWRAYDQYEWMVFPKPDDHITENELLALGFKIYDEYEHDQYHTKVFALGCMQVDMTYEGTALRTCDLTIDNLQNMPMTLSEITVLVDVLGEFE